MLEDLCVGVRGVAYFTLHPIPNPRQNVLSLPLAHRHESYTAADSDGSIVMRTEPRGAHEQRFAGFSYQEPTEDELTTWFTEPDDDEVEEMPLPE